ncbi:unnamed protein product [Lasius platythorax]|uniref:Uncharacterized protein n=2 Tax=Lasius TaxID=488720 RepID=A0AAV2NJN9_9HYME
MSELKQQYKNPHPGFGNVDHRILRDYKHVESLKEMRTRAFYDNRDLVNISVASPQSAENVPAMNRRLQRYQKWKKERNKRRKLQNAKKKLLSKVGSVPSHSPAIPTCNAPTLVASPQSEQ